ncbi:MAG: hypothetical protein BWK80_52685 [Desulfobacteraceae bacterium IS3]|nr:MAG: hypothetical protein BWK80_52685 [Desulfobacteraceae bacterium IS3]
MKEYVLDTSAILAFIENEDGAETVENLLMSSIEEGNKIFISAVTLIEIFYISVQEQGSETGEERLDLLGNLPLIQESLTPQFTKIIGKLKAYKSMSFADCCIAGLAKYKNAVLVHKDPEFEQLEENIEQLKLPYKKKK